jgi:hypothetical protein
MCRTMNWFGMAALCLVAAVEVQTTAKADIIVSNIAATPFDVDLTCSPGVYNVLAARTGPPGHQ